MYENILYFGLVCKKLVQGLGFLESFCLICLLIKDSHSDMKKVLLELCLLLCILSGCGSATDLYVATYNIRYRAVADADGGNAWQDRKGAVAKLILSHGFDVVGTQEGDQAQLDDLRALLPGYAYIAHPYGGADGNLHNCATFYKEDKYEVIDQGTFWYSETPDVKSLGWDASDLRICNWGKFRDKVTKKEFFLFNSHFYWRKKTAKEHSGGVLVQKLKAIAGNAPVICTGDFNSREDTPQIKDILAVVNDAYRISETAPSGCEETDLGGGNFEGSAKARIDYVFVSPGIRVRDYAVIEDRRENGHYPSDHLPVACHVTLP